LIDFEKVEGLEINLVIQNLYYQQHYLGKMTFHSISDENELQIKKLQIISSQLNLNASGLLTKKKNQYQVNWLGSAYSPHLSELLISLGINVNHIMMNQGKIIFNLTWDNSFFYPENQSLNGFMNVHLGPGRILDLGKRNDNKIDIGKMLNIFGLQTIPRRLSFDFSDIFQKGYSFDLFDGSFIIKQGNIYTHHAYLNGSIARIGINGRIGLINHNYDLTLSISPYVTSSLPLAATLINPSIGLAAFAANILIGTVLSKANTDYYSVKGPWKEAPWINKD